VKIDPRAEWRQMFDDAWRITRDWFYDPKMHGVDWDAMRVRYGALVPYLGQRADLDFVLGEMISELQAGHTYVASGDEPRVERVRGGMLGAELAADPSGRYRIAHIFPGENWDETYRSPLTEPGIEVREGEFLLAVDGMELTTKDNPYRLLEGKADRPVVLTVHGKPELAGARKVTVRPVGSELGLRYLDWVRSRMALVDRLSGGESATSTFRTRPSTATACSRSCSTGRPARRRSSSTTATTGAASSRPHDRDAGTGHAGLVEASRHRLHAHPRLRPGRPHGHAGERLLSSGGDALPYFFRKKGLGRIFGTRTWGGLIGLSGNPSLLDGGAVQVPTFRIYDEHGRFVVENEGVSPDEEVFDLPEALAKGGRPHAGARGVLAPRGAEDGGRARAGRTGATESEPLAASVVVRCRQRSARTDLPKRGPRLVQHEQSSGLHGPGGRCLR
jgi:tricorn protease